MPSAADFLDIAERLANRYARAIGSEYRDDLYAEASLGLVHGTMTFDAERGVPVRFWLYRCAKQRAGEFVRRAITAERAVVSIYAYSATELIHEWRSDGMQEQSTLIGEVKAMARAVLPPAELDVILSRAIGTMGAVTGRAAARRSEAKSRALRKLRVVVNVGDG